VGGVLYGLEETSTFFATSLLWKTLNATAIATFCIAVYHGGLDKFSVLTLNMNDKGDELVFNRFQHIHYYIIVGLLGGLLGALFNSTILYVSEKRKDFFANAKRSTRQKEKFRLLEVALLSVFTSTIIFFLPLIMPHSCTTVIDPEEQSVWHLNCKSGEYNEVAKIMLGTRGKFSRRSLLVGP
jgi:H+/Cl- antiporter ClcA